MRRPLLEVAGVFLKLGAVAFGGPAAHLALMEDEIVRRRRWVERQEFLDLLGATNLIPGPNSTEIAILLGLRRAGWYGLVVAGVCFILPAAFITGILAWAYVTLGTRVTAAAWWSGIQSSILVVIALAAWRLGRAAVKSRTHLLIGIGAVLAASFVHEVLALLGGGLLGMTALALQTRRSPRSVSARLLMLAIAGGLTAALAATLVAAGGDAPAAAVSLTGLGLFFLKVGAILYGSGYVLVAFLEDGLVRELAWLSQPQLLDAVAFGQFTPGPVLSTATFIGYLLAGPSGAVVATAAIFLPSFLLAAALSGIIPRLRRSIWSAAFIDAVNVSAIGLMVVVTARLSWTTMVGWRQWAVAAAALAAGFFWNVRPPLLLLVGAAAGLLLF